MTTCVPSDAAREHLARLLMAGLTMAEVGRRAGLSRQAVDYVRTHTTVTPRLEQAILNVSGPTHFGGRRRVAALLAVGWTTRQIEREAGLCQGAVSSILTGRRRATDAALPGIVRAYEAMWRGPAHPNPITLRHAQKCGYAPPMAWDDDTIDDPEAAPQGVPEAPERLTVAARVAELLDIGCSVTEIPSRVGARDITQVMYAIRDANLRQTLRERAIAVGMLRSAAA